MHQVPNECNLAKLLELVTLSGLPWWQRDCYSQQGSSGSKKRGKATKPALSDTHAVLHWEENDGAESPTWQLGWSQTSPFLWHTSTMMLLRSQRTKVFFYGLWFILASRCWACLFLLDFLLLFSFALFRAQFMVWHQNFPLLFLLTVSLSQSLQVDIGDITPLSLWKSLNDLRFPKVIIFIK